MSYGRRPDKKGPASSQDAAPSQDQTIVTPAERAYRSVLEQDHAISMLMEMQASIGQLRSSFDSLKSSVDGVKTKVDDLVAWKHKILGGAVVLGAVAALLGFGIRNVWDRFSFQNPASQQVSAPQPVMTQPQQPLQPQAQPQPIGPAPLQPAQGQPQRN